MVSPFGHDFAILFYNLFLSSLLFHIIFGLYFYVGKKIFYKMVILFDSRFYNEN